MADAARLRWWAGYVFLTLMAIGVSLASMRFWTFNPEVLVDVLRPNLIDHPIPFYLHTTLAPVALLIGVWQFLPATRRSWWHRWAGRLYVASVLLSAISGFVIAFTTTAGPVAATGFAILAVLWFGSTLQAYRLACAKDFQAHRRWMIRSYALTCAAISLRVILPLGMAAGLEFLYAYWIAAWGCWTINLVIAEILIARRRPAQAKAVPAA